MCTGCRHQHTIRRGQMPQPLEPVSTSEIASDFCSLFFYYGGRSFNYRCIRGGRYSYGEQNEVTFPAHCAALGFRHAMAGDLLVSRPPRVVDLALPLVGPTESRLTAIGAQQPDLRTAT